MTDWSKFDSKVDTSALKNDVKEAAENGGGNFVEVPVGDYEVKISKMELAESKKGDPMVVVWFDILEGSYKGQKIFMYQVITQGFQIHIVNEFLRSLESGVDITFESYSQYNDLLMDVNEAVESTELLLKYGETKKGFKTFTVQEVFEVE